LLIEKCICWCFLSIIELKNARWNIENEINLYARSNIRIKHQKSIMFYWNNSRAIKYTCSFLCRFFEFMLAWNLCRVNQYSYDLAIFMNLRSVFSLFKCPVKSEYRTRDTNMCRPACSRITLKDLQLYFLRTLSSSTVLFIIDPVSNHTVALQRSKIAGSPFYLLCSLMLLHGIPHNKHNLHCVLSDF